MPNLITNVASTSTTSVASTSTTSVASTSTNVLATASVTRTYYSDPTQIADDIPKNGLGRPPLSQEVRKS
jgi:hypothetical protein